MMEFTFLTADCICLPSSSLMKYWLFKLSVMLDSTTAFFGGDPIVFRRQQVGPGEKQPGEQQDKGERLRG